LNKWAWPAAGVMLVASVLVKVLGLPHVWIFICSALTIVPLAAIMGRSTEAIAAHAGARVGGLMSATFGNAVELIIGIIALRNGMTALVKASITGSILGNLLLVLGVSFFVGGIRHPIQRFNIRAARSNASMLLLGVGVIFGLPAIFESASPKAHMSLYAVAASVSFVLYVAGLFFSLFTHRELFDSIASTGSDEEQTWRLWPAVFILLATTALVSVESEWLVDSIKIAGASLGWSNLFMGVVVIAIIGNAAEHASAVLMAWKNRMDLSLEIAVGSSLQVAMFVAPVLFALSLVVGHPMPLNFTWPELAGMGGAVVLTAVLMTDGESHWLEGAMAVGAYLVVAVGFYTLGM
jgi:Ca2+:H+ antiporter